MSFGGPVEGVSDVTGDFGVVKDLFLVVSIVLCKVIRQSTIACPDRGLLLLRAKSHFDIHLFETIS